MHLTAEVRWAGHDKEEELSEKNMLVMDCFKDFVKYNPFLLHLDL